MPVRELAPSLKLNSNNTYVGRQFVQYPRKRWFRAYGITLVFKRKLHPFGKENQYCNIGPLFSRRVRKLWHILVTLVKKILSVPRMFWKTEFGFLILQFGPITVGPFIFLTAMIAFPTPQSNQPLLIQYDLKFCYLVNGKRELSFLLFICFCH